MRLTGLDFYSIYNPKRTSSENAKYGDGDSTLDNAKWSISHRFTDDGYKTYHTDWDKKTDSVTHYKSKFGRRLS
jgi:hypothetical protein